MALSRTSHAVGPFVLCTLVGLGVSVGCGASSKRDMNMPPKEVTYADACNLQEYFDQRANAGLAAPKAIDETQATNEKGQAVGEGTYELRDPLARRRFGRMLREEYSGVEAKFVHSVEGTDGKVTVHVRWWDAGPIRRVRPTDDIVVDSPMGVVEIPPNICVGDFLFGDKVYAMRARFLRNEVDLATDKPLGGTEPSAMPTEGPTPAPAPTPSAAPSPAPAPAPAPAPSASK